MPTISQINQLDYGPKIDLPLVVSDEQTQSHIDQGYLIVPDLMTTAELDEICDDMIDLARGKYPCENLKSLPDDVSDPDG
jgi:hypothetical protein